MTRLLLSSFLVLCGFGYAVVATAADQAVGQSVQALSKTTVWNSLFALVLVLGIFFACVWMLRKMNIGNGSANNGKMRIVGGLALGMREKVVLLQVGSKQLVLAVTPGRIETLTVLEGEDCLMNTVTPSAEGDGSFAQKLMQALKNRPDA